MTNPIQYTSRTFQTILADINSDKELADKPEWFKRLIAGVGDVMSMCLDAQANNNYLETAFTRDAVKKLCQLIGYRLGVHTTSAGKLKFYLADTTVFPITVTKKDITIEQTKGRLVANVKCINKIDYTTNMFNIVLLSEEIE